MTGIPDSRGPVYISSHSADVILSEVRPIKLQADALKSINVLLDEVLYKILAAARSLSTEKLRAGLLKVLPTSLGKDALLEAEVELRAYKDRTSPSHSDNAKNGDDQRNFHLQWAFELLRLKCEAYCTLNESDEDPEAETRLQNRMGQAGGLAPPKAALVAPASLYLTAILEALCEHILSNVARVAARDSSKTSATIQDIFVALCEDNSIYALFRQLKVYEQIESHSNTPKPRRSKSLSVGGGTSNSDLVSSKGSGSHNNSRVSSDSMGSSAAPSPSHVPNSGSRGSSDKARSMKMFGKISTDREALNGDQRGHKKSDSFRKDETRQNVSPSSMGRPNEDAALLQEFDNLMLSDSTMKVSLTPDRLKSMDTFNKERSQRSASISSKVEPDRRTTGRQSSLRAVDLIAEDEEESPAKTPSRNRTTSTTVTPTASPKLFRARSSSASHPPSAIRNVVRKSSRPDVNGSTSPTPVPRERRSSQAADTFPTRNRKALHPLNAADLNDDMRASDDEEIRASVKKPSPAPRTPLAVSSKTRDLIDFLSEGPPGSVGTDPRVNASAVSLESGKSRSGRLQRMISKLSMGNSSDKQPSRANGDSSKKSKSAASTLPPPVLANKPILPRPPPPVHPPSSSSQESFVDVHPLAHSRNVSAARPRSPGAEAITTTPASNSSTIGLRKENGTTPSHTASISISQPKQGTDKEQVKQNKEETVSQSAAVPVVPPPITAADTPAKTNCDICSSKAAARTTTPLSTTETKPASTLVLSLQLARDIQRQMSVATTAEECRLLFDMFLAKSGIPMEPANDDLPYPSPAPSLFPSTSSSSDSDVENLLAEFLLGTDASSIVDGEVGKAGPANTSIPSQDSLKPDADVNASSNTLSASATR